MNELRVTIVWLIVLVTRAHASETINEAMSLEAARELGRSNSRLLSESTSVVTDSIVPTANVAHFHNVIEPVLLKSCLGCHGPNKTEGRLRVDKLAPDLLSGSDVERWREIYNAVSNSAMPPEDEPDRALTDLERERIVSWLGEELDKAAVVRRDTTEHSSFRRMTKYEYNDALQDLLGLPFAFATRLPPETESQDGFKNSSALLQMSTMQFETYREIGLAALKRATVGSQAPQPVTYDISMPAAMAQASADEDARTFDQGDENYARRRAGQVLLNRLTGDGVRFVEGSALPDAGAVFGSTPIASPVVLVLPGSKEVKWNLDRFLPDDGIMRVRIRAGRTTMNPEQYASLRLIFSAHTSNNANFSQVVSQRDILVTAAIDNPQYITFDISLADIQRNPFRKLETTFPRRDEFLSIRNVVNADSNDEPLVYIDHIQVSAPYFEQWPPKSHSNIFFESNNNGDELVYGREVLSRFMRRAWRRPVSADEVESFVTLFSEYRVEFTRFEDAMLEVLATILAAPEFLYITHRAPVDSAVDQPGTRPAISDVELASRLSFFLWSSIPDETLLDLAEQGQLREPKVLEAQVERMLADSRSKRFSEYFVQQWLGMDGLEHVTHVTDSTLKEAMREEPIAFFEEVLRSNGSVIDFVHSNYVVVNESLAKHYQISHVYGPHFRKVSIDPHVNRGGILTAAGVLAMNSDGKDSHPVKRGVWMLERILQDPPPPPPPNVPEVDLTDPRILKMTLKERIADHRNKPACQSCHAKIDPWGIAFENYDALGAYRSDINDQPIDATALLFNKQQLAGTEGLKRFLLIQRQDQIARAIVDKLTSYALGRPLSFADRADIDKITRQFRRQDDRLRDLIQLIVRSDIFSSR